MSVYVIMVKLMWIRALFIALPLVRALLTIMAV